jgi:hypothetical protein
LAVAIASGGFAAGAATFGAAGAASAMARFGEEGFEAVLNAGFCTG